jgi:hypothetical protein
LYIFIQANWTGPTVKLDNYEPQVIHIFSTLTNVQWLSHLRTNKNIVSNAIQTDGEVPFAKAQFVEFLYIAQLLLVQRQNSSHPVIFSSIIHFTNVTRLGHGGQCVVATFTNVSCLVVQIL